MKMRARARLQARGKALLAASIVLASGNIRADDFGAATNGNWEDPSTWVSVGGGIIPGANDNVVIGGNYVTGSATVATVTLTANESVNNLGLGLGYSSGAGIVNGQGTLDLNGFTLAANSISIGAYSGDIGTIARSGGGSFSTNQLTVGGGTTTLGSGNTFTFGTSDVAQNLTVNNGATVNMSATNNIGAGSTIYVNQGGTLNAGGYNINASNLYLSSLGGTQSADGSWILSNPGTITTTNLTVGDGSLILRSSDSTQSLTVGPSGQVTTTVASNIAAPTSTSNLVFVSGGTLTLGADLNLSAVSSTYSGQLSIIDGGTVDAQGHNINARVIFLGDSSGGSWTLANPGTITTEDLYLYKGSLTLTANLAVVPVGNAIGSGILTIESGGQLTTTTTGNISGDNAFIYVENGGTLTLGADLKLPVSFSSNPYSIYNLIDVESGGTLDMGFHNMSAYTINLMAGSDILNKGQINATNLIDTGDPPLALGPHDSVVNLSLNAGALVTTSATSNVTGSAFVSGANSLLTLGADLNVSGLIAINDNGTIDAQGHNLIANDIELGTDGSGLGWSLLNRGAITTNMLGVANGTLALTSGDSIGSLNLGLGGGVALGQNVNFAGTFSVNGGATFDAQGYSLTANDIELGTASNPGGWTLLHQGQITAATLNVYGGPTLAFGSGDSVTNLGAYAGASVTTSAVGNLTGTVSLDGTGTTLQLGAALTLSGALDLTNGASLNAQGHDIAASLISIGFSGASASFLISPGAITTTELDMGNGSLLTLTSGRDTVGNLIDLTGAGTTLTVEQSLGRTTGLTLNGAYSGALVIDPGASLVLDLAQSPGNDWAFRWQDPIGGNWIGLIDSDIASGDIIVNAPNGYQVYDLNGFTYIGSFSAASVPEPSSIVMLGLGCAALIGLGMRQRRHDA
jgi:fibronectin-binding autotransporter adhesin